MAASTGQINVEALDSVLKSIGTTYNALKALDAQMDATLINKFAKLAQGVNQFVNALSALSTSVDIAAGIKKVQELFKGIGELKTTMDSIGKLDETGLTKFSNAIYRFTLALQQSADVDLSKSVLIKGIVNIYNMLGKAFTEGADISSIVAGLDGLLIISKTLGTIMKSLGKIDTDPNVLAGISSTIKALVSAYVNLSKTFSQTTDDATLLSGLANIKDVFKTLLSIVASLPKLVADPAATNSIATTISELVNVYTSFNASFAATGGATVDTAALLINFGNFKTIIKAVVDVIKGLPTKNLDLGQLANLQAAFTQIITFYTGFGKIVAQQADDSTASLTANLLKGLGALVSGIGDFFSSRASKGFLGSLGDILAFRLALGQTVVVMRNIIATVSGLDTSRVDAIASFAKGMGSIFTGLADFFKLLLKSDIFNFNILDFVKRLIQIRLALIPIGMVLNTLKPIFKAAGQGDAHDVAEFTKAVAAIFNSLTGLFDTFSRRENKAGYGTILKTWLALKAVLNPVGDIISQFKKVPKGVDFSGLGAIFEAIGKFADPNSIKNFGNLNSLDLSGLSNVAKQISGLIQSFSGLDDNAIKRIDAIAKLIEIIPELDKLKELGAGGGGSVLSAFAGVQSIAEQVASGVKSAVLQLGLFYVGFQVVKTIIEAFNPVNIIAFFSSVGDQVNNLILKVKDAFKQIQQLGSDLKGFGENLNSTFGIFNITGTDAFRATVEFDKLGSSLEVFGGLTKEQRKNAEAYANVLGKDYPLSANEALKATLDLVKAGQSAESAKSILGPAADLASLSDSGSIEQATAFIIQATSAFKQFNDTTVAGFENTSVAVNIISSAADSSTASVEELSDALVKVGPVASGMGLSLEETTAALALLADGGIKGAEAGTQLKSLLTSFTTATAQKELKKLHISLTDSTGAYRPLNDIITDISKKFAQTGTQAFTITKKLGGEQEVQFKQATSALSTAQRNIFLLQNNLTTGALGDPEAVQKKIANYQKIADNAVGVVTAISGSEQETQRIVRDISRTEKQNAESLQKIGGSYGAPALSIFLAEGEDGLNNFVSTMNKVAPASERAKKALDNISGDMLQLQGSVETLTTKALLPLLEKFFRPFVQIGRFFIDTLLTINDSVIEFIATAGVLSSALLTAVAAFAIITGAIIEFGGAVLGAFAFFATSIPTVVLAFLGGIVGFAAGIIALAGAFAILAPIIIAITSGFQALSEIFSKDLGGAATQLERLGNRVGDALRQIGTAIGQIVDFVVVLFSSGTGSLSDVGKSIGDFFYSVGIAIAKFQVSGAGKALTDIGNIFAGITKALSFDSGAQKAADDAVGAIDNVNMGFAGKSAREAAKARSDFAKQYSGFLADLVKNNGVLKSVLGDNLTAADIQKYLEKAVGFVEQIRSGIGDVFGSFGKAFASAQEVLKGGGNLGEGIGTFVAELGKNLDKSLGSLSGTVLTALSELFNFDSGDLAKIFSVQGFGAGVGELIQRGLKAALQFVLSNRGAIGDLFTGLFDFFIVGGLNQAANTLRTLGASGLADIISGVADILRGAFRGILDTIFNLLEGDSIEAALQKAFGPGIQPILDFVKALATTGQLIGDIIGKIIGAFSSPQRGANGELAKSGSIFDTINTVIGGITNFITFINSALSSLSKSINLSGILGTIGNVIGGIVKGVQDIFGNLFKGNDLGGSLSDTLRPVNKTLSDVFEGMLHSVLDSITGLFKDFDLGNLLRGIFDAIPQALKSVNSILGKGAGAIFDVFANVFNFKDAFLSASLKGGGLLNGIKVVINRVIKGITGFLSEHGAEIRDGFISFFTGAFQGIFNLGATITKALGLNDLSTAFGGIAEAVPNFFKNFFGLIFDVINGKDLATALLDTFGPGVQPILDFVSGLQGAVTQIQTFAQGIIDAIFKPALPGGEPPIVIFLRGIGDAFGSVITFLQTQVLAPLAAGDAGLAISNLAQGVLNLVTGIAGAIATEIGKLDLPTVFKNVATAIVGGIGSALEGIIASIGDTLGFDASSFINNIDATMSAAIKALGSGDAGTIFTAAAGAIINLLLTAIGTAVAGIAALTGFDATAFLNTLDGIVNTNLEAINAADVFGLITNTLSGLIGAAIIAAFDLLKNTLNIDTSGATKLITDALQGISNLIDAFIGDGGIFDSVGTILDNFVTSLKALLVIFNGPDAEATPGNADAIRMAIGALISVFAGVVSTTILTISDIAVGVAKLLAAIAKFDPGQMLSFIVFLSTLISYYAGGAILTALAAGIGFLATSLVALGAGITAALAPILAIAIPLIVFSQTLRALAQNVDSVTKAGDQLKELDFAGLLGNISTVGFNIFSDLAFNIAGIFGVDSLFGHSRADFQHYADVIEIYFTQAFSTVGTIIREFIIQPISDLITVGIPLVLGELNKMKLAVQAAAGDTGAADLYTAFAQGDAFAQDFGAQGFGNLKLQRFSPEQLYGTVEQGGAESIAYFKAIAARDKTNIFATINDELQKPENQQPETRKYLVDKVVRLYGFSGLLDDAITKAAQDGDTNLFQSLIDSASRQGIDTTDAQRRLADDTNKLFDLEISGETKQKAIDRLNMAIASVISAGLDPTYLEGERDKLQKKADILLDVAAGGSGTPVAKEVPVTVTPVVKTNPARNADGTPYTGIPSGTAAGAGATGNNVTEVPVKIAPRFEFLPSADGKTPQQKLADAVAQLPQDSTGTAAAFDASSLSNPDAVNEFNSSVTTLATNITALGKELAGIPATETIVVTTLTNIQTAVTTFRDVTVPLFGEVKLAVDPIAGSVQAINNALISLFFTATVGFPAMAASAFVSITSIAFSFFTLSQAANTSLQNVINKVTELATGFRNAAAAAAQVQLPPGTGGPVSGANPPGRAGGGTTKPYSVYEVHDTKSPEIYNDGKRSLLLTGAQSGFVTNLGDSTPSLSSGRSTGYPGRIPQAAGPTFNASNITINEGTISITVQVQGGANATPQKIAEAVRGEVAAQQRKLPTQTQLSTMLRTNHR